MASFVDIKDPWEREMAVKDYVDTVKRIQQRNEDEKVGIMHRQRDLEEQWRPVVQAQNKMAEKITTALEPMKEEVFEHRIKKEEITHHHLGNSGPLWEDFKNRVLSGDPDLDTSFGIRFVNGKTLLEIHQ